MKPIFSWSPARTAPLSVMAALVVFLPAAVYSSEAPPLPPLTTVSGSPRLPGKFVWADLVTDDVAAARTFYGRLLGWTFRDVGGYAIAENAERPLAGIFQRPRPKDRPLAKPRWFGYISVPNVDKVRKVVISAGGKVLAEPAKIPKRGEQAVFADPEGALFGVVRSSGGDPADFQPDSGDWMWIQLLSRDARKASEFYRTVAGYEVIENTSPGRASDFVLASKGYARATVRTIPAGPDPVEPTWLPFVRVPRLNEALARVRQLGGSVLVESKPELFDGVVAVIADPTGAALGLIEADDRWLKGGR